MELSGIFKAYILGILCLYLMVIVERDWKCEEREQGNDTQQTVQPAGK